MSQPPASGPFLNVSVNERDVVRIVTRLDRWQGRPLADRMKKAMAAGVQLYIKAMRGPGGAPRGATGGLQKSVKAHSIRARNAVIAEYRIWAEKRVPDKGRSDLLEALLIYGTKRGVSPNPFVDRVRTALEPAVTTFINEQVQRLA